MCKKFIGRKKKRKNGLALKVVSYILYGIFIYNIVHHERRERRKKKNSYHNSDNIAPLTIYRKFIKSIEEIFIAHILTKPAPILLCIHVVCVLFITDYYYYVAIVGT